MAKWTDEAKTILEARYLKKDKNGKVIETPDQMLERVAKHVASAEKTQALQADMESKFINIMDTLEFLPNSPTLMNAGRELGQLSACFVLPIEDDLSNIFETVKQVALIHKTGGGTGIVFSHLRPGRSMVQSTSGVASGPVSFMRVFDTATDVIKQGGVRRGANMGCLGVWHPDIREFITCKNIDQLAYDELEKITDPVAKIIFRNELDKQLAFQNFNISVSITDNFLKAVKANNGFPLRNPFTKEKTYVKANEIFDLICHQAWLTGEPGVIFIDTINAKNPIPWMGEIEGTNPCLTGETKIALADGRGPVSIKQLTDEGKDVPVYCKDERGWTHIRWGRNPRLTGKNQKIIKVDLDDGSFVRVTENHRFLLNSGEQVEAKDLKFNDSLMRFDRYQFNYKEQGLPYWGIQKARKNTFQEHRLIAEFMLGRPLVDGERVHHKNHHGLDNSWSNLESMSEYQHSKIHDISGDRNPMRRFPEKNPWNNSEWQSKQRWGRTLSQETKDKIGLKTKERFADQEFKEKHRKSMVGINHKVVSVTEDGFADVFNITVDEFHNYCVITSDIGTRQSGITLKNCGEQPLLPHESCNLGSIDVSKFVKDGKVDWDHLEEVVSIAVRFLDNVIDVNKYPNVKIMRKTTTTRKVGLGIMGWADLLIKLGIRYDSEKAIKLAKRLMMNVRESAHIASRDLGKEKGNCFDRLKRRNSTLTTIAPTGTLSILADCSSSIEPLFGKEFTKTVLNGVKLNLGKKYKDIDDKLLVTAFQIPVEKHLEMQAAFQLYTDNAVSKTINLQHDATEADVRKAFLLAHELGCKGITCYREGSRKSPIEVTTEGQLSECENGKCPI
jgi:ribonucleotide reductase alpha subunit